MPRSALHALVAVAFVGALGLPPARLHAQDAPAARASIIGSVRDSTSGGPIAGAVVVAFDQGGATLARGLTTERGLFRLVGTDGARRMQVLRIGFRPVVIALEAQRDDDAPLDVRLARLPTLLERVRVTATARCPTRPDRADAWALLEQARAGLLASIVARETNPPAVQRLTFLRTLDPTGQRVETLRVRIDSSAEATTSFYASRDADAFVRDGFRSERGTDQTFYGPDAEVLLDERFAGGYCFQLAAADAARPREAGVAFSPARTRRGRVDITGAVWIDTVSRSVTEISFRYLGLDRAAERAQAGGQVHFRELPNGVVFIDRWWLRALETVVEPETFDVGSGRVDRRPRAVRQVVTEIGGELATATWPDDTRWDAPLATLDLVATTEGGAPAAGAVVGLLHTDHVATADSAGRLQLGPLLPGPYQVVVVDRLLGTLGVTIPTTVQVTLARTDRPTLPVTIPTAESFLRATCRERDVDPGPNLLLARIVDSDGVPALGAGWRVRRSNAGQWETIVDGGQTGSDGQVLLCRNLELGDLLELQAWRGAQAPERVLRRITGPVTAVPMTVRTWRAAVDGGDAQRPPILLTGTLRDTTGATDAGASTGAPVAGARISLAGTLLETVTESDGTFLLGGIPRGDVTLEIRTAWLDSIGAVQRVPLAIGDSVPPLQLALSPPVEFVAATCNVPEGQPLVGGVIVGRVRSDLPRQSGVRVTAAWPERRLTILGSGRVTRGSTWVEADTDERGTYRLCGVPLDEPVELRAQLDADAIVRTIVPGDSALGIPPRDTTVVPGAYPLDVTVPSARRFLRADVQLHRDVVRFATFTGTVVDSAGRPIVGAEVTLQALDRSMLTNAQGRFRFTDVTTGTQAVLVRREGYIPVTAQVPFEPNRVIEHRITLWPAAPASSPASAPASSRPGTDPPPVGYDSPPGS
jgi:hypothetical protein